MDDFGASSTIDDLVDPRLATIFWDMQHFVALINEAHYRDTRLRDQSFQEAFQSIGGRLIHLEDKFDQSMDDFLRLGLLAFLSTTFKAPCGRASYKYLSNRYQQCCQGYDSTETASSSLIMWLLIMGGMIGLRTYEPWLRAKWKELVNPDQSWSEVRRQLQSVMWINFVHDEQGQKVFGELSGGLEAESAQPFPIAGSEDPTTEALSNTLVSASSVAEASI
jgi:hypothetical protein